MAKKVGKSKRRQALVKELMSCLERVGGFRGGEQPSQEVVEDALDALTFSLMLVIRCSDEPPEEVLKKMYVVLTHNMSLPRDEGG